MEKPRLDFKPIADWACACALLATLSGCGQSSGMTTAESKPARLPEISQFREQPSDQFLVEFDEISRGHPFKGMRSIEPHAGAHIHFDNSKNRWPKGADKPPNYPAIFAVADGTISRVDFRFGLPGGNDRYGLDLAFAVDAQGKTCRFCYSIEPMIPEPEKDFYRRFLLVGEGDNVRKGDIIAYMFTPPGIRDAHIHFHLQSDGRQGFFAPAIFTTDVARQFHARWGDFGRDGETRLPPCLGYRLDASENPFGTGAMDRL